MKQIKSLITPLLLLVLMAGVILTSTACTEQSPLQSLVQEDLSLVTLARRRAVDNTLTFPLTESRRFRFLPKKNCYDRGALFMEGTENKLGVREGSITPPPEFAWGDQVTITMTVDFDGTSNQLLFEFGPAGVQFSPDATIRLDYRTLGIDVPTLYYIDENRNYIQQRPESIDVVRRWLKVKVSHFSRYALAWSN